MGKTGWLKTACFSIKYTSQLSTAHSHYQQITMEIEEDDKLTIHYIKYINAKSQNYIIITQNHICIIMRNNRTISNRTNFTNRAHDLKSENKKYIAIFTYL